MTQTCSDAKFFLGEMAEDETWPRGRGFSRVKPQCWGTSMNFRMELLGIAKFLRFNEICTGFYELLRIACI